MLIELQGTITRVLARHPERNLMIAKFVFEVDGATEDAIIGVNTQDELEGMNFSATGTWVWTPNRSKGSMRAFRVLEFTAAPEAELVAGRMGP